MHTYLASHALSLVGVLAWFVMLSRMSGPRRTSQSTFAWLLAFALVPLLAIPLYLALGHRKFPRRAKGRRLVVPPPKDGHTFELVTSGETAFARLTQLVEGAQHSIELTMFIFARDATGRAIVQALAARARAGVSVRVVLDAVGCLWTQRELAQVLRDAGAECRLFMPLRHSPVAGRTNLRCHRKVAIFDGVTLFAGGMNIAEEYLGPEPNPARWRDVSAIVRGPAAADALALFASDWEFCGGSPSDVPTPAAAVDDVPAGERVQWVPSGPDMTTDTMYDLLLGYIFAARERLSIVTPYYVPDEALQHALVLASRRGVRVELVLPARSNHRIADVARRPYVRELTANGARVFYFEAAMVHAKAMVVDTQFAYVGSPNFDMRSLFLNYEDAVCVYSPGAIGQVRAFIETLAAECASPSPHFPERPVLEQMALLLAPEL